MDLSRPRPRPSLHNSLSLLPNQKQRGSLEIIWGTLRNVREARLDSALGICGLASLYLFRWVCDVLVKRFPLHGLHSLQAIDPWLYSSPDVLHFCDQERVRGCRPHACRLGSRYQFQWQTANCRLWRSSESALFLLMRNWWVFSCAVPLLCHVAI